MGKKNLDKLFQEKLSNFSEVPDQKVWQSIDASLDKKKKSRKVIPIWWKFAGVAAVLAIALYIINPFEDTAVIIPTITESESQEDKSNSNTEEHKATGDFEKSDTEIVDVEKQDSFEESIIPQENTSNTTEKSTNNNQEKVGNFKSSVDKTEIQIANTDVTDQKQKLKNIRNANPSIATNTILKNNEDAVVTVPDIAKSKNSAEKQTIGNTDSEGPIKQNNLSLEKEAGIAQVEENETLAEEIDDVKKSIFDEIIEQEKEKETVAENKGGKWSAGASIAPVYFDAIGEGSPVHSIFVPNSKSGDLNVSYGLSVAYEISTKLKIRSGVHRVDYGYSTNDVEFSSSIESSSIGQIANVNYSATAKNIVVASNAMENGLDAMENVAPVAQDFSGQGLSQNGIMTQQFGYLEVPVELEYALIDKKFGVNLIGGISSLFLVDNSISLSSGELITGMGEANNVNDINFSTNVGIGLNYKFTSKVQLNVEPVFKYQLNTFSQTDGTFQPFTVGVYSGISFKF